MRKLAIIGGGPAGLAAAKWAQWGLKGHQITLFEKLPMPGGIWASENNYSHAWNNMSTNLSRYSCVFSDFPHEQNASLFPTKQEMHRYLSSYIRYFNLQQYIQYNTTVVHVNRIDEKWQITFEKDKKSHSDSFDHIIVANGMFSIPNLPQFNESAKFRGKIIHSAQYKQNIDFSNKDVVIVGGGFSAVEIASNISKTARSVFHVNRKSSWIIPKLISDKNGILQPLDLLLYKREFVEEGVKPLSIKEKNRKTNRFLSKLTGQNDIPDLYIDPNSEEEQNIVISNDYLRLVKEKKIIHQQGEIAGFEENEIILQNNSRIKAQIVICCTGYRPDLNFLAPSILKILQHDPRDSLQPAMLYESVLHPQLPDLFFIGMGTFRGAYFPIMELQARLAVEIFSGRAPYPNEEEILTYFKKANEIRANHQKPQFINSNYSMLTDFYAKWANLLPPGTDVNTWSKLNGAPVIPSDYLRYGSGANPFVAERERSRVNDFMKKGNATTVDTIKNLSSHLFFPTNPSKVSEIIEKKPIEDELPTLPL